MLLGAHNAVASTQCCAFINAVANTQCCAVNAVASTQCCAFNAVASTQCCAFNAVAMLLMLVRAQNAALLIFSCLFTGSAESSHRNDTNPRKTQFRVMWFPAEIE